MSELVQQTAAHVKKLMDGEGTGHDWWHVQRVWNNAKHIAKNEDVDLEIVELAALLHDIADWKFSGDDKAGGREARNWLESINANAQLIEHVCHIVDNISFKGGTKQVELSNEGKVVQDADRLDAIGAIGIARAFAYGGYKERELYNPNIPPQKYASFEEYKNAKGTTINHFHEKILLLKDRMNTKTAKHIAEARHKYTIEFLEEFQAEWDAKR